MDISKIKALCEKNNVSIWELERATGIGNGVIGKWGNHGSMPRLATIKKVAAYFGCTVDELLPD